MRTFTMELKIRELVLRPVNHEDLLLLQSWHNSADYMLTCTTRCKPITFEEIEAKTRKRLFQFLVLHRSKGPVGTIFSNRVDFEKQQLFITTFIEEKFRNTGYGPLALVRTVEYCFENYQFSTVYFDVFATSLNSKSCFDGGLDRLGVKLVDSFVENRRFNDTKVKTFRFSFSRESRSLLKPLLAGCS
ncbi:MAG TPA: GNAT family protein [Candidatus Paceibacterota bacterium]|nr:GNAT family protein [Candidatus Paceibacterota bacterium]